MGRRFMIRLVRAAAVLFGITFLSFILTALIPGDPARIMLEGSGMKAGPEALAALRHQLGLDLPLMERYLIWLGNLLRGDLGTSFQSGLPVAGEIGKVLPATIGLSLAAFVLTILISIPAGLVSIWQKGRWPDRLIRGVTYLFSSMPSFYLALILLYVFAFRLRILPVIASSANGWILPAFTLALPLSAWYIREIRGMLGREMGRQYITGMRMRGISESRILLHALHNSIAPLITLTFMSFGNLLAGSAIVESIFVWPGAGRLAVNAITARDYPLIQGYVIYMAAAFILLNLAGDLCAKAADPRMRRGIRI
jgi:ABC-type dipeptide/oligopeptide/nickel transport system permease component